VSFAAVTLCVASQRVFIVVVDFVIDSVRKLFGYTFVASCDAACCVETEFCQCNYVVLKKCRYLKLKSNDLVNE
jgi:hypothetical protein